jgi:hypothetical protein
LPFAAAALNAEVIRRAASDHFGATVCRIPAIRNAGIFRAAH